MRVSVRPLVVSTKADKPTPFFELLLHQQVDDPPGAGTLVDVVPNEKIPSLSTGTSPVAEQQKGLQFVETTVNVPNCKGEQVVHQTNPERDSALHDMPKCALARKIFFRNIP